MRNNQTDFLSGILVGLLIGMLMGYIITKMTDEYSVGQSSQSSSKKVTDWAKHPLKSKRVYLENLYLESSKIN